MMIITFSLSLLPAITTYQNDTYLNNVQVFSLQVNALFSIFLHLKSSTTVVNSNSMQQRKRHCNYHRRVVNHYPYLPSYMVALIKLPKQKGQKNIFYNLFHAQNFYFSSFRVLCTLASNTNKKDHLVISASKGTESKIRIENKINDNVMLSSST